MKGVNIAMKSNLTKITKIILDVMFIGGIIVTATLPLILKVIRKYMEHTSDDYHWLITILLGICGVCAIMIIWELRKIFKTVIADDCFVRVNVTSLRRMGDYSFVISGVMFIRCAFLYVTLAALAMVLVFVIAGLFSKVLAQVFDRAVTYKLENDFTI